MKMNNNNIVYIIKESSDPKLVGKKLILEFDAGTYWFEKYILTIFKDRKDVPMFHDVLSYIELTDFLEDNRIKLDVARSSKARYNRYLLDHSGMPFVFNVASGLYIFGISFNKGESVQQSIIEKRKQRSMNMNTDENMSIMYKIVSAKNPDFVNKQFRILSEKHNHM